MELSKVTGPDFELFVPLSKINEKTGEFTAWATLEEIDQSGEIIDLDKSWPYFEALAARFAKITDGANYGPIREQHDPNKAAGQLIAPPVIKMHESGVRGIEISGLVTDEGSRKKLNAKTLTGISIGGKYVGEMEIVKVGDRDAQRFVADPNHYGLVDSPCVKGALVTCVKADGSETKEPLGFQAYQVWKCSGGHDHEKKAEAISCAEPPPEPLAKLAAAQRNALDDSDFALPGRRYPIDTEARGRNALARVAQNGTPEEQATVKRKVKAKYPNIDVGGAKKADEASPMQKCMTCVQALSQVISGAQLVASMQDMEAGDDGDTTEADIAAEIRTATGDLFDALRALIDDVEVDDLPSDGEMAMAVTATMTKLATDSLTAIKSLRVPTATGANSVAKETEVKEEPKKDEAKPVEAAPETVAKAEGDPLAKALEANNSRMEKLEDAFSTLTKFIGRLPGVPKGVLRAVTKEADGADGEPVVEKLAPEGTPERALQEMKKAQMAPVAVRR